LIILKNKNRNIENNNFYLISPFFILGSESLDLTYNVIFDQQLSFIFSKITGKLKIHQRLCY